jgi:SAM-dependent methyltransferase
MKEEITVLSLRNRRLALGVDLDGEGLEYGALHIPILSRSIAPNIRYVDYADRDFLVEKYKNDEKVIADNIVDVDIVTEGKLIDNFVEPDSLDYIVASHVAEHVPDLIGWLGANLRVLRPGGRIAIAFPDKRYTFDIGRRNTEFSDLVAAFLLKRTQPDFSQVCDHIMNIRQVDTKQAWSGNPDTAAFPRKRSYAASLQSLEKMSEAEGYDDVHCWVFTPETFRAVIELVQAHFLPNLEILSIFPTLPGRNEFLFTLGKSET